MYRRITALVLALILLLSLTACQKKEEPQVTEPDPTEGVDPVPAPEPEPEPEPEEFVYDYYKFENEKIVEYYGPVEHIFFHQVIAYPELAFDGDDKAHGIDDWMCTIPEVLAILDNLYEKGYILVDMNDVWSEYVDANGNAYMAQNTLRIPEGRKPFVMSLDDICYYNYMLTNGFMHKLIIGDDGEIWAYGIDPDGNEVISQDLDIVTILDKYIKEHPDFCLNGAKACLALTGYEGILGYRTNTDTRGTDYYDPALRAREIEAVKPVIEQLKKTGWYFGSHTWGHIRLDSRGESTVRADMERWMNEVGSLVGETTLLFYPHGARPDGDDVSKTGPVFKYLHSLGFRVFSSVGINSFVKIKKDIPAVVCDRLHPDGTTLRWSRKLYLQFYDAKEVYDYANRPDYGYDFG